MGSRALGLKKVLLLIAAGLCAASGNAFAADLSHQSKLGEVFAERPRVIVRGRGETRQQPVEDTWITLAPRTPGYYGKQGDYAYRSYYGTAPETIFTRLPYSCGFVGLC